MAVETDTAGNGVGDIYVAFDMEAEASKTQEYGGDAAVPAEVTAAAAAEVVTTDQWERTPISIYAVDGGRS